MPGQRKRSGQPLRPSFAGWRLGIAAATVLVAPIVVGFLLLSEFGVLIDDDASADGLGEFVTDAAQDGVQDDSEPTFVLADADLPLAADVALLTDEPRFEADSGADAADTQSQEESGPQTYIVVPGDTLASIAVRQGSSIAAIAAFNGIENVNRLDVGQRIQIPPPDYVPPPPPADPDPDDPAATGSPTPPLPPGPTGGTEQ